MRDQSNQYFDKFSMIKERYVINMGFQGDNVLQIVLLDNQQLMGYECICDDKYIKGLDLKRLIDTPQDLMNQLKKSEKLSISMEGAILFSMNVEDKSIPVEIGMKRKELNKFEIASFQTYKLMQQIVGLQNRSNNTFIELKEDNKQTKKCCKQEISKLQNYFPVQLQRMKADYVNSIEQVKKLVQNQNMTVQQRLNNITVQNQKMLTLTMASCMEMMMNKFKYQIQSKIENQSTQIKQDLNIVKNQTIKLQGQIHRIEGLSNYGLQNLQIKIQNNNNKMRKLIQQLIRKNDQKIQSVKKQADLSIQSLQKSINADKVKIQANQKQLTNLDKKYIETDANIVKFKEFHTNFQKQIKKINQKYGSISETIKQISIKLQQQATAASQITSKISIKLQQQINAVSQQFIGKLIPIHERIELLSSNLKQGQVNRNKMLKCLNYDPVHNLHCDNKKLQISKYGTACRVRHIAAKGNCNFIAKYDIPVHKVSQFLIKPIKIENKWLSIGFGTKEMLNSDQYNDDNLVNLILWQNYINSKDAKTKFNIFQISNKSQFKMTIDRTQKNNAAWKHNNENISSIVIPKQFQKQDLFVIIYLYCKDDQFQIQCLSEE